MVAGLHSATQQAAQGLATRPEWQPARQAYVGSRNKKNVIAEEFDRRCEVARVVMNAALEGDMQAANMVLQRLSPPLRARAEKVTFELTPDALLHQQANRARVGSGRRD